MNKVLSVLLLLLLAITTLHAQNTASFVGADTATQGNYLGKYGADGAVLQGATSNLPGYGQVSAPNASTYIWAQSTTDPRALQYNGSRIASTWYSDNSSFYFDVLVSSGVHRVTFYLLDWDTFQGGRSETLQVTDGDTGAILASATPGSQAGSFINGVYLIFNISGHVHVNVVNNLSTSNESVSGVFFDPTSTSSTSPTTLVAVVAMNPSVQAAVTNGTFAITVNVTTNSNGTTNYSVALLWTASSTQGVTGYNVYRSTVNGGPYTKLNATPLTGTQFTDANVAKGTTYYYTATAVAGSSESSYSSQATVTVPAQ